VGRAQGGYEAVAPQRVAAGEQPCGAAVGERRHGRARARLNELMWRGEREKRE
jgi:hypothetical protein